jgi:hypothetical protein
MENLWENYRIMPEKCKWMEFKSLTAEMAFRAVSCWFDSKTKVAVMNTRTGETVIFTRKDLEK